MVRLLADENLNNPIVRGVRLHNSVIDIIRVVDVGLTGVEDAALLQWAAENERILITHDANTMINAAKKRIESSLPMPGLIVIPSHISVGAAISDLQLIAECSLESDWVNQIVYLPL